MKKNTKIFCCFPGTGKSYMKAHEEEYNLKLLDSDSSEYHWIYENGEKKENPNFISDYVQHIKECFDSKEYDYIFVSTHTNVIDELENIGLPFSIVLPSIHCKGTYMDRYKARGNDSAFIDRINTNWESWVCDLNGRYFKHGEYKYILGENQYVKDIILEPQNVRRRSICIEELKKQKLSAVSPES